MGISAGYLLLTHGSMVLITGVLAQDLICLGFSALSDGGWKSESWLFPVCAACLSHGWALQCAGWQPCGERENSFAGHILPARSIACRVAWGLWSAGRRRDPFLRKWD